LLAEIAMETARDRVTYAEVEESEADLDAALRGWQPSAISHRQIVFGQRRPHAAVCIAAAFASPLAEIDGNVERYFQERLMESSPLGGRRDLRRLPYDCPS
jgi:hypothetical protein